MIPEKVQSMIDNEGVYIVGSVMSDPVGACTVIYSVGGKLIVLQKDRELDPTRFMPGMIVKHGPLK